MAQRLIIIIIIIIICLLIQKMQNAQSRPLSLEHPLEEEMTTHSSILAWKILWTREPGGLQSIES